MRDEVSDDERPIADSRLPIAVSTIRAAMSMVIVNLENTPNDADL